MNFSFFRKCSRPLKIAGVRPAFLNDRQAGALSLAFCFLVIQGCGGLGYYAHLAKGQYEILKCRTPVDHVMDDPGAGDRLKEHLAIVKQARRFARQKLDLEVKGRYGAYADLGREHALWVVFAANEFSLNLKTWCFPIVGCVSYRSFFSKEKAAFFSGELKASGLDVDVSGVDAYSTLGWMDDPVLNTFVFYPEPLLVELIFHELAHGRLYVDDDTVFNESFATAVALEGARRWFAQRKNPELFKAHEAGWEKKIQFIQLIQKAAKKLQVVYGSGDTSQNMRRQKAAILDSLEKEYLHLKKSWGGYAGYDGWFSRPVNNARIASVGAYYDLVPGFLALMARFNNDLPRFYVECEKLAQLPPQARRKQLMDEAGRGVSLEMDP